jgi:hypothetical protein
MPTRRHTPTHAGGRPLKITFGEMREMGLRGVLFAIVAITLLLAPIAGRTTFAYLTSSRALCAPDGATGGLRSGLIFARPKMGTQRMRPASVNRRA